MSHTCPECNVYVTERTYNFRRHVQKCRAKNSTSAPSKKIKQEDPLPKVTKRSNEPKGVNRRKQEEYTGSDSSRTPTPDPGTPSPVSHVSSTASVPAHSTQAAPTQAAPTQAAPTQAAPTQAANSAPSKYTAESPHNPEFQNYLPPSNPLEHSSNHMNDYESTDGDVITKPSTHGKKKNTGKKHEIYKLRRDLTEMQDRYELLKYELDCIKLKVNRQDLILAKMKK